MKENTELERKMIKRNLTKDEKTRYDANNKALKEISERNINGLTEFNVYEMAQRQIQRIADSRKSEKDIQSLYMGILNQMLGGDTHRVLSPSGYEKAKRTYLDSSREIGKYTRRVPTITEARDRKGIFVQRYDTGAPDTSKLTEYEQMMLGAARGRQYSSWKQIRGYEISNGIRGMDGRLLN